jgi:hypothetical protein
MDDMLSDPEELTVEAGLELQPVTWRLVDLWKHTIKDAKGRVIMLENSTLYAFKSLYPPLPFSPSYDSAETAKPPGTFRNRASSYQKGLLRSPRSRQSFPRSILSPHLSRFTLKAKVRLCSRFSSAAHAAVCMLTLTWLGQNQRATA